MNVLFKETGISSLKELVEVLSLYKAHSFNVSIENQSGEALYISDRAVNLNYHEAIVKAINNREAVRIYIDPVYKEEFREAKSLDRFIILDPLGARHGTIKANNRKEAIVKYYGFEVQPENLCNLYAVREQDLKDFKANVKNLK